MLLRTLAVLAGALVLAPLANGAHASVVPLAFYADESLTIVSRDVPVSGIVAEAAAQALVDGPTAEESASGLYSALPPGTSAVKITASESSITVDLSTDVLAGLDETRLLRIFQQFSATLADYPESSSILLTCKGKPLSGYLKPAPVIGAPAPPVVHEVGLSGLAGRKVTIGPSHGLVLGTSSYGYQRPQTCGLGDDIREDLNSIRLMQFLHQYLVQDGAVVTVPRTLDQTLCCHVPSGNTPWWKMAARYWLEYQGLPSSVWNSSTSDTNDDIRARPLYADYVGADIYIAHHTNAASGTASGTEVYRDTQMEHPAHEANSYTLAKATKTGIEAAIRDMYDPAWPVRNSGEPRDSAGGFGEIRIPNRPACLVELAFHDNCTKDALYLVDNFFRSVTQWGLYKGICDYFGTSPTWAKYSCEYVSDTIPATMNAGQAYNVSITMRNRGVLWSAIRAFRLGAVDDSDPFTLSTRVALSGEIRPGQTFTFSFQMTAPAQGTYITDWRMVRDGYEWFGPVVSKTVQVTGQGDFQPPTQPQALTATVLGPTSIRLNWQPSTDNVGVVGYDVRRNSAIVASPASNTHTDTGLTPGTGYTYQVRARDEAGNVSSWSDFATAFTQADTEAPSVPANVVAVGTAPGVVQITWAASTDNVGVTSYDIRRDGSVMLASPTASFTESGLVPGQTYSYEVRARDAAGNASDWSAAVSVGTPLGMAVVFSDGFNGSLANWTQQVGAFDFSTARNHGDLTGGGSAYCAPGESDQMYHVLSRPFAQARLSGWFYDPSGGWKPGVCGSTYRQSLSMRAADGSASMIIDNCMASNVSNSNYFYRTVGGGGVSYTSYAVRNPDTDCAGDWIRFETEVIPGAVGAPVSGTISLSVTDGAGRTETSVPLQTDFFNYGVGRVTLGLGVSSAGESWWDDIVLEASPPAAPALSGSALSTDSILWSVIPSSANAFGYDIADAGGTPVTPSYPDAGWLARASGSWTESGLAPNTAITRKARGWNGTLNGPFSSDTVRYTLSVPPTASTVTGQRQTGVPYGTPAFGFTAVGGFGEGTVQYYRYAWDQSADGLPSTSDPVWSTGDLEVNASSDGSWYLHVTGYNGDDVPHGSLTLGPYVYQQSDPPGAVVVTDEGTWTPSLDTLSASWTEASQGSSPIAGYEYAVGTSVGAVDVRGWTDAGLVQQVSTGGLALQEGQTYYIGVRAKDGSGTTGPDAWSDGITAAPGVDRIGQIWALPDGQGLSLRGKTVTAALPGVFWLEELDRSAAVRVDSATDVSRGDIVSVAGVLGLSGTQRALDGDVVLVSQSGQGVPVPVRMRLASVGGSSWNQSTPAVDGKQGLYNIGLLVTCWGVVTSVDASDPSSVSFYLDDGSGAAAGAVSGVRVSCGSVQPPSGGMVAVTGIVGSELNGGKVVPVIIIRDAADIVEL